MNPELEALTSDIISDAKSGGATDVEVFSEETKETNITIRENTIDMLNISNSIGVGVRIFYGKRVSYVFACDFDRVRKTVKDASKLAAQMDPDECVGLPDIPDCPYPNVNGFDPEIKKWGTQDKANRLFELEAEIKRLDHKIVMERSCYRDKVGTCRIVNTAGLDVKFDSSMLLAYGVGVIKDGNQGGRGFFFTSGSGHEALFRKDLAERCVRLARASFEGKSFSPREMTVVMDTQAASDLIEALGQAVRGDLAMKNQSFLSKMQGQKIGVKELSIIDDRTIPGNIDSMPFDGEGMPAKRIDLVQEGVLKGFLSNTYWGRRLGTGSSSSATRRHYDQIPSVGPSNLYIAPSSNMTSDEIIASVDDGILVMETNTVGGIDPVTGIFSTVGCGFRIEKGKLTWPVAHVTIAGKMEEMLKNIKAIGSDLDWYYSFGSPTIAISGMVVGGH